MKRKKIFLKLLTGALLILSLAAVFPVFSFAEEQTDTYEENSSNTDFEKENPFAVLFKSISDNSAQILSALSFASSLLLMLSYKKGLIPIVKEGLGALGGGVKSIGKEAETFSEGIVNVTSALEKKIEATEAILDKLYTAVEELGSISSREEERITRDNDMKKVLLTEIEMLYEIFMSASLPQYQKDRVGEKVSSMKSLLSEGASKE